MEIWKNIMGFEGLYQISNLGRVKSLPKQCQVKSGCFRITKEKILKMQVNKNRGGYIEVVLYLDKKPYTKKVHRLVAEAFLEDIGLNEVNHIDGDKSNNVVSNIEYCTRSYNNQHAYDTGLKLKGENHCRAKLTEKEIIEIRELKGKLYQKEIAKKYCISQANVSLIHNYINWK